jgi:hypothetical protein
MGFARSRILILPFSPAIIWQPVVVCVGFLAPAIGARTGGANAQTPGVREHYAAGINAYQRGDLEQAELEFRAALKLKARLARGAR